MGYRKFRSFLVAVPAFISLHPELNTATTAVPGTSEVCTRYKSFKGAKAERSSRERGNVCSKAHMKKSWWLMMILS